MKLHFLGTGAADWDIAHPRRGKDFRRFASLLVDDALLIDPGPCIYEFAQTYGYPHLFQNVSAVVNTHRHSDHFSEQSFDRLGIPLTEVEDFQSVSVNGYRVTAYPANHGTVRHPQHFVIESEQDGKRFFYGCDGSWLPFETAHALRTQHFDAMIFDCTIGDIAGDFRIFEHNNIAMVIEMREAFAHASERFFVSHMARTLHTDHDALTRRLAPLGITPAYDDMIVEL